ncbi:basic secretory family protein [Aspergillus stella-maris]|uniref:basic secretory family protein n=1 Tax=Aspergillus stella-maris TaxID=1810926 RepID=UPI003CCC995D
MATPSPIPPNLNHSKQSPLTTDATAHHRPSLPAPKFRLQIDDVRHPAAQFFLKTIPDLASTLETALKAIIQNLYTPPSLDPTSADAITPKRKHPLSFKPLLPPTRSVTILLRDIGGVAYTTGRDLDNDHKEIHISLSYIQHCQTKADPLSEIVGVITHELVHCYQYAAPRATTDGKPDNVTPRAPGGLVEGVADFVRLKAGLSPPHWTRPSSAKERPEKWDSGYQHTAYFLAWLEDVRVGRGAVGVLNDRLARAGYVGDGYGKPKEEAAKHNGFWKVLYGNTIQELWDGYGAWLDNPGGQGNWEDEIVNP